MYCINLDAINCVTTHRQNVPYEKKKEHIVKITLLSPQSKMYRKRGIFSKSLRYAPLTLTTLAALVPEELNAEIRIIDEGVEDLNIDAIDADLVGITCITPNAPRVYDLSRQLREMGITVVIGGVHPTLVPDEA